MNEPISQTPSSTPPLPRWRLFAWARAAARAWWHRRRETPRPAARWLGHQAPTRIGADAPEVDADPIVQARREAAAHLEALARLADILGPANPGDLPVPQPVPLYSYGGSGGRRRDDLYNPLSGFGTPGDKSTAAQAPTWRYRLTDTQLRYLYTELGYVGRFVDLYPKAATRRGWQVRVPDRNESRTLRELLQGEETRLRLRARWRELDKQARLYGGAVMLLVTRDAARLHEPLEAEDLVEIAALHVFNCAWEAFAEREEGDPTSAEYRRAAAWRIAPATGAYQRLERSRAGIAVAQALRQGQVVHSSRVIYLGGAEVDRRLFWENGGRDDSVIQRVWTKLRDLDQTDTGLQVLVQQLSVAVLKMEALQANGVLSDNKETVAFLQSLARMRSSLNMITLRGKDDFKNENANPSGAEKLRDAAAEAWASVVGVPRTILDGQAPGGFNTDGESHRAAWRDEVLGYQVDKYETPLMGLYTLILSARSGPTGGQVPEGLSLQFRPIDAPTAFQSAELQKKQAETAILWVEKLGMPAAYFRQHWGADGYEPELPGFDPALYEDEPEPAGDEPPAETERNPALDDAPALDPAEVSKASDVALNGAQITSALAIVERVAKGELPRENGLAMLEEFFNMGAAIAEKLLGEVGRSFQIADEPAAPSPDADPDPASDDAPDDEPAARRDARLQMAVMLALPEVALGLVERARAAAEAALDVQLVDTDDPHLTVVYLGRVSDQSGPEIARRIGEVLAEQDVSSIRLRGGRVEVFNPDGKGRTPVVVRYRSRALASLHDALYRALTPFIAADQFRSYLPHVTLGYAAEGLSAEQVEALGEVSAGGAWGPAAVELWGPSGKVLTRWSIETRSEGL